MTEKMDKLIKEMSKKVEMMPANIEEICPQSKLEKVLDFALNGVMVIVLLVTIFLAIRSILG